jgi:hypothetical protein
MRSEKIDTRAVVVAFLALALLMFAGIAVPRSKFVLVVGWPGASEARMMQIITGAGGTYVEKGGRDWLAIARSDDPALATRLMRAGAMIVLDHALAAGCSEDE